MEDCDSDDMKDEESWTVSGLILSSLLSCSIFLFPLWQKVIYLVWSLWFMREWECKCKPLGFSLSHKSPSSLGMAFKMRSCMSHSPSVALWYMPFSSGICQNQLPMLIPSEELGVMTAWDYGQPSRHTFFSMQVDFKSKWRYYDEFMYYGGRWRGFLLPGHQTVK